MNRWIGVAALALAMTGCTITETVPGEVRVRTGLDPDDGLERPSREKTLLARIEADPKDAKRWFELGDYYERGYDLVKAAQAYEEGYKLLDPNKWTGGHYLLARIYSRLNEFDRAMRHLDAILEMEPKDVKAAVLNPHFRDAHYLRGAILYLHKQWRPAKKEFIRFVELGGNELRVEEWLDNIMREIGD